MSWDRVAQFYVITAMCFDRELHECVVKLYIEDLQEFKPEEVISALHTYRRTRKASHNTRSPLPCDLIAIMRPESNINPDDTACLAAEAIVSAVKRFGHPWPNEARKKIGELGWRYVERFGGWSRVCEELGDGILEGVFVAQAKQAIRASLSYGAKAIDLALERGGETKPGEIEKRRNSDLEPTGGWRGVK